MAQRRNRRSFGILMKIPKSAYDKAMKKVQADRRVVARYRDKKSGWASVPAGKSKATNRDRAVVEVYRFQNRKRAAPFVGYLKGGKITNWTGIRLCTITRRSSGQRIFSNQPGMTNVTARCIDGHTYVGRGKGDGMYIRMRPKKGR